MGVETARAWLEVALEFWWPYIRFAAHVPHNEFMSKCYLGAMLLGCVKPKRSTSAVWFGLRSVAYANLKRSETTRNQSLSFTTCEVTSAVTDRSLDEHAMH
jgi:hypothetical protein